MNIDLIREQPKRILHIVSSMDRGGAETLIMNVYRNINLTKYQFDFVCHKDVKGHYDDEIFQLGGRIYRIPSLGQIGPIRYMIRLIKIIKSQPFIAIHSHTDFQSGFPALAGRIVGIKHRICHSHSTGWLRNNHIKNRIIFKFLRFLINFSATRFCSCSKDAGAFLFGGRAFKSNKGMILRNGIDLENFMKVEKLPRKTLYEELSLPEDSILIGHVGTFSESKNHIFIIKIIKQLVEKDNRYHLILVGDGPLKLSIEEEAERIGISEHIKFLGVREDIPRLMKAFHVFLFPSFFEGFGLVAIEAQSVGTPCILSDTIPKETDMGLGLISFVSLDKSVDVWCKQVESSLNCKRPKKTRIIRQVIMNGYDIRNNINEWLSLYGEKGV